LKLEDVEKMMKRILSRPSRARGLKPPWLVAGCGEAPVAPFTGAWIETVQATGGSKNTAGRALHGRVD